MLRSGISILLGAVLFAPGTASLAAEKPWVLVDTKQQTLTVLQNQKVLEKFNYVALGRGGTGEVRRSGDGKTPLGEFHVAWVNDASRFDIFFGLDFPSAATAEKAYQQHVISREGYDAIMQSIEAGGVPIQDSALGGYIGIHGIGQGDLAIHQNYNWTEGCVALTNPEIEELARYMEVGTKVIIR